MKFLKDMGKNTVIWSLIGLSVATTVVSLASAVESSSTEQSTETKLTSDDIDKIMEDIKLSTNIDNVIQKLDDIIKRAELMGNDTLKDYAEKTKSMYELQQQIDTLTSQIEAIKKKSSDVDSIDKELKTALSVTTVLQDMEGAISDETLRVLESLKEEKFKELNEVVAEISGLVDLNDIDSMTLQQRCLLDVLMLYDTFEKDLIEGDRLSVAKEAYSVAITALKSYEKQKYGDSEYSDLVTGSEEFSKMGKKAELVYPEQVVFYDGAFNLKNAPIMYDGHILISIDDLYQYIDASIEYMYNNATMVIQSPDIILEITAGKNVAYVNDAPKNMVVPVLNVNEKIYIPAEFFAEVYGISYRYVSEHQTLIMYKNLNQLEEGKKATPNNIYKGN